MRATISGIAVLLAAASSLHGQNPLRELHRMAPPEPGNSISCAIGDVDGDGDLDLMLGAGYPESWFGGYGVTQRDRLYLNDGTGAFLDATTTNTPSTLAGSNAIVLFDMDGDGDLDALAGNGTVVYNMPTFWYPAQNRLYSNDGTGVFTEVTTTHLPQLTDITTFLAISDVDGDADLDVWLGYLGGGACLYLNDGTGIFTDATTTHLPTTAAVALACAFDDVDSDGDPDALIGCYGQNHLYINDGTGVFTDAAAANLPADADHTISVGFGDVDGDGDLDALLGNSEPSQNRLYLNDGTGVFTNALSSIPRTAVGSAALTDLDGDGDVDAIMGDGVYHNDGMGWFRSAATLPGGGGAIAVGDVDGDADPDLWIGQGGQDDLYLNDGTGAFSATVNDPILPMSSGAANHAFGDVDGDGDLDIVLGHDVQIRLYRNDGSSVFAEHPQGIPRGAAGLAALGDLDGDGDLDAIMGEWVCTNDGTGSFSLVGLLLGARGLPVLGDVDGDGDLDVMIGLPIQNRLFLNDGTGRFTDATATNLPPIIDPTNTIALGDLDGDGDLDALVGNTRWHQNRLHVNDGTGVFTDVTATQFPQVMDNTNAVALVDLDGDGDLDALMANEQSRGRQIALCLNDGTGVFHDATATNLPARYGRAVALGTGDLDGDGDLDVLALGYSNDLYFNDGSAVFSQVPLPGLPAPWDPAAALIDIDGDDDADAMIESAWLFTNVTSHLAWHAVPRIGKPLTMDLYGSPGGTWLLAAALGRGSVLYPFGTLRLDPSVTVVVDIGTLDPQGQASATLAVPANPSLVGLSIFWQAALGAPLSLTNLEITTLTGL